MLLLPPPFLGRQFYVTKIFPIGKGRGNWNRIFHIPASIWALAEVSLGSCSRFVTFYRNLGGDYHVFKSKSGTHIKHRFVHFSQQALDLRTLPMVLKPFLSPEQLPKLPHNQFWWFSRQIYQPTQISWPTEHTRKLRIRCAGSLRKRFEGCAPTPCSSNRTQQTWTDSGKDFWFSSLKSY